MAVLNTSVNRTVAPGIGMQLGNTPGQVNALPVGQSIPWTPPGAAQVINQPSSYVPPTGLIGSEAALMGGLTGGAGAISSGAAGATGHIQNALASQAPVTNFGGNVPSIQGGVNAVTGAIGQGVDQLGAYAAQGEGAAKLQADLTGANGVEAQQAAYSAYQSSPAMQYQMDQMQRATERSAAAQGGLLGGNVLQELQRNAAGIASQDYQNQFNNMSQVTGTGLNAANSIAGLRGQEAGNLAGLHSTKANIAGQLEQARIGSQTQQTIANNQMKANLNSELAGIAERAGLQTAGMITQTGGLLSQGRLDAGYGIAQNATQAASQISQLLTQQGMQVSDIMAKDISNITDMIYQAGAQDSLSSQNLAAILANIAGGQASTVAQGQAKIGEIEAAGQLGVGNAIQGGIQQGIANYSRSPNAVQPAVQPTQTIGASTGQQYSNYA
jgi:hypothetical protein